MTECECWLEAMSYKHQDQNGWFDAVTDKLEELWSENKRLREERDSARQYVEHLLEAIDTARKALACRKVYANPALEGKA